MSDCLTFFVQLNNKNIVYINKWEYINIKYIKVKSILVIKVGQSDNIQCQNVFVSFTHCTIPMLF